MIASQRRSKILELLQEEGSARVVELSNFFKVSEPTIRQDLMKLEEQGFVLREHGGAFLKSIPQQVSSLSLQHSENMVEKARIGKKAAEFIFDGESIILDSGTTTTEIAKNLTDKKDLKIITNSLNIALLLGTQYSFEIMITGGEFKAPTLSLTGEKAADFFDSFHVDKLFLATGGLSLEAGLTYPGFNDLKVKMAMIHAATEVFLVADSSKIGKISFASLGDLELVNYFITDSGIDAKMKELIEKKGVNVVVT